MRFPSTISKMCKFIYIYIYIYRNSPIFLRKKIVFLFCFFSLSLQRWQSTAQILASILHKLQRSFCSHFQRLFQAYFLLAFFWNCSKHNFRLNLQCLIVFQIEFECNFRFYFIRLIDVLSPVYVLSIYAVVDFCVNSIILLCVSVLNFSVKILQNYSIFLT